MTWLRSVCHRTGIDLGHVRRCDLVHLYEQFHLSAMWHHDHGLHHPIEQQTGVHVLMRQRLEFVVDLTVQLVDRLPRVMVALALQSHEL